mmetsp:Transcript_50275/g.129409  ORF Transcript_50275/g.129409 Transcript_50275/m.129409 type:complete len:124 (-) Transcript_50275:1654-2025(-)
MLTRYTFLSLLARALIGLFCSGEAAVGAEDKGGRVVRADIGRGLLPVPTSPSLSSTWPSHLSASFQPDFKLPKFSRIVVPPTASPCCSSVKCLTCRLLVVLSAPSRLALTGKKEADSIRDWRR